MKNMTVLTKTWYETVKDEHPNLFTDSKWKKIFMEKDCE
jgi:hypothetical protein